METDLFETRSGIGVTAVTADEMEAVDRVATEAYGVDLLQRTEHAGRALASHAMALGDGPVTVVVGNGGNGAGGLAAARHLDNRGRPLQIVLDRPPADCTGPVAHHLETLGSMGVSTGVGIDALERADPDLIVDALIGYGLQGQLRGTAASLVAAMNTADEPVLSLDVPSGLDATDGGTAGAAVEPARLVTLALPKIGLASTDCLRFLADIGIPTGVYEKLGIPYRDPFGTAFSVALERTQ